MISLIKSVLSPMSGMKIDGENEKELDKKLHTITQYIINSPKQFDQWMELQNKNKLHDTLHLIYEKYSKNQGNFTQQNIASIIQFYTLLLSNCHDELLLAKLVSDSLVFELCLLTKIKDKEELDAYRINLWKAYLGTTNLELIKYMVINQKFTVFQESCKMFKESLGMVEQTTIANIILNIMKKVNDIPFLWESIWRQECLISLFTLLVEKIGKILKEGNDFVEVEEIVLFFTDIVKQIKSQEILNQMAEVVHKDLDWLISQLFVKEEKQVMLKDQEFFTLSLCLIFPMFYSFKYSRVIIDKTMNNLLNIGKWIIQQLESQKSQKTQIVCRALYLICRLTFSKYALLSVREDLEGKNTSLRNHIGEILILILKTIKKKHEQYKLTILLGIIKYSLLSLFKIFLGNSSTNIGQNFKAQILQTFLIFITKFKKMFEKNQNWETLIKWYQHDSHRVLQNLLFIPEHYEAIHEDQCRTLVLILQYIRNYRYMLIEQTSLQKKELKQQKFYFSQFASPGCSYEPGKITVNEQIKFICGAIFHHNFQQLPVSIVNDQECFVIMYKVQENSYKTIINVKFKSLEGFIYGNEKQIISNGNTQNPRFIKVLLKGLQEVILQFPDPKVNGNLFKEYMVKQKDFSRQRQLKFLKSWVQKYEQDTIKTLKVL